MEYKNDNILSEKESIEGLLRGVNKIHDLIVPTYGGAGSDIVVESTLRPYNMVVNDAWSIIKSLKFTDVAEKRSLAFIQELCERADKMSGDARKTTILLCAELLRQGYEISVDKKILKKQLDDLIIAIEDGIDAQTKKITVDEIGTVATTASESVDIGALLQEIYQQIGPEGIIDVEGSGTFDTSYIITEGIKFMMTGYLSSSMVHDEQAIADKVPETKAVYEHPLILVTKKKITVDDDINPLLWEMKEQGNKDLVIFTSDMDSGVASMLINLHKKKEFNILIIKAPTLWRDFVYEDFAKCTGATIVEDATGVNFKNLQMSHLGTCDKIIVDEEDTILRGIKDISVHKSQLRTKGDDDSMRRVAWLTNKTAVIKLGANSETDLSGKRLKCNDAVRSSSLALRYGIVPGGGLALFTISRWLYGEGSAVQLIKNVLQYPLRINIQNAGVDVDLKEITDSIGFDSKNRVYVDMMDAHIVDSAKTLKNSVRNAIGIASTMLTQKGIVYIPSLTPEEMAYQVSMNKTYEF